MGGLYLLEQAIIFGGSHILFLKTKYATSHFLPYKFKKQNPGVQSFLQATGRQHKLRFCSESSPREAPLYAAMVECTLIKQVIQQLFVHKGMETTSTVWNVEEEAFTVLTMVLVFGDKPHMPHGTSGAHQGPETTSQTCQPLLWLSREIFTPGVPTTGRKISPTALCLVTKKRQEGREAAELFTRSQLKHMAGIWLLKNRKQLIPHWYETLKQKSTRVSLFFPG